MVSGNAVDGKRRKPEEADIEVNRKRTDQSLPQVAARTRLAIRTR
ncbi:hypothetical protein [Alloactinosynnema sp. L-07]|nr:hypothetical protein [Alloactinosynnema sp. L-07]